MEVGRRRTESETVEAVLHYGYDPACGRAGLPAPVVDALGQPVDGPRDAIVARGVEALRTAVGAELDEVGPDRSHVVPLSAGLDSRAILAALVERPDVDRETVRAVTFGTPGTWDFEIGGRVAEAAGVRRTAIDLTADSFDWSPATIRADAATRTCPGGALDGYVNSVAAAVGGDDAVVWSGFMGDPTAGGHQPADPSEEWTAARRAFATVERRADGLGTPGFDPTSVLPDEPFVSRRHLSYEEQLDFACRQRCLVAPTVLASADCRTPFLRPAWLSYSLNLPRERRRNRSAFVGVCRSAYPDLFALPTDATAGYPLSVGRTRQGLRRGVHRALDRVAGWLDVPYTHPDTNYLDFETAFRSGRLRPAVEAFVGALAERDVAPWPDPEAVWRDHLAGADRTDDLHVLVALELYLGGSPD